MEHYDKSIHVTMVYPGPIQTNFLPESFTEKSGEVCIAKHFISGYSQNSKNGERDVDY
jgi:short-subunit dehydrogenase